MRMSSSQYRPLFCICWQSNTTASQRSCQYTWIQSSWIQAIQTWSLSSFVTRVNMQNWLCTLGVWHSWIKSTRICWCSFFRWFCLCPRHSFRFAPFLSAKNIPERVSVARAHCVVHDDVEGGVDVGKYFLDPLNGHVEIMVATSNVHIGESEPHDTQHRQGKKANCEQHRIADQHLGQRHLPGRDRQRRTAACRWCPRSP